MAKTTWNSDAMRACDKLAETLKNGLDNTLASLVLAALEVGDLGGDEEAHDHDDLMQRLYARAKKWSKTDRDAAFAAINDLMLAPLAEKPEDAKEGATA